MSAFICFIYNESIYVVRFLPILIISQFPLENLIYVLEKIKKYDIEELRRKLAEIKKEKTKTKERKEK